MRGSLVVILCCSLGWAAPVSAGADSKRLRAKARAVVERHSAALERRDWRAVCHYLSPPLRRGMVKIARKHRGLDNRRCADAARLLIDPSMSRLRIRSMSGSTSPLLVEIVWHKLPDSPTVVRIGRSGVGHWTYLEYPIDPRCRYCD
jgi:hypothetical protein